MAHEVTIHVAQTSILRELLFVPEAGFAKLQKPTGLTSNHFNFHIARLMELGLVEQQVSGRYRLTVKGKEYANRLDTDNNTVERQPKSAVMLMVERHRDGRSEFLFQERLKHPYYGYWGRPTGKIRWGETILGCAARELMEETGLTADHQFLGLYHQQVAQRDSGELLEDKLFFCIHCTNVMGETKERFDGGRNAWMTMDELMKKDKLFSNFNVGLDVLGGKTNFVEATTELDPEVF